MNNVAPLFTRNKKYNRQGTARWEKSRDAMGWCVCVQRCLSSFIIIIHKSIYRLHWLTRSDTL
jgi:hypothetical protein